MFSYLFFFKQKTAYEMRISDWSSDVCSSDLPGKRALGRDEPRMIGGAERHFACAPGQQADINHPAIGRPPRPRPQQRAACDVERARLRGDADRAGGLPEMPGATVASEAIDNRRRRLQ